MSDEDRQVAEAEVEREIRQRRKFTPQEAMGRMAGPGAMKGASAVSPQQQAENEVGNWLRDHVNDPTGSLQNVLHRAIRSSELLLANVDRPLVALRCFCERFLSSDHLLKELVRETDVEWGRAMDERPHFERDGQDPHPDDPYTLESVRERLTNVVGELGSKTD